MATATFSGGVAKVDGYGQLAYIGASLDATWATGDTWSLAFSSTTGDFTVGKGNVAGISPKFCYVFGERAYIDNNNQFNFSALGDVTGWEQQNIGAGSVTFTTSYGALDAVAGFAAYQGRLAVFGRRSIQIWQTNADPTLFTLVQTLTETGTIAPQSIHSLGELDVLFLADTGIRSLRVRDQSLNAMVTDLGSAINVTLQAALIGLTSTQKAASCGIVEPTSNRYWLFLTDTVYVLSYFPSTNVTAWSTYKPTYQTTDVNRFKNTSGIDVRFWYGNDTSWQNMSTVDVAIGATSNFDPFTFKYVSFTLPIDGAHPSVFTSIPDGFSGEIQYTGSTSANLVSNQTSFTPQKFVVYQGQVYVRDASGVYLYGGSDNNTYDNCVAIVETPWLAGKTPGTVKTGLGGSAMFSGAWNIHAGMDPKGQVLQRIISKGDSTAPDAQVDSTVAPPEKFSYVGMGTHIKMKAYSKPGQASYLRTVLSEFLFNYKDGNEK